jgi:hypothetical protein
MTSTYDTIEASASLGNKLEMYLFEVPNSDTYWAHTTDARPVTVDGITYTPLEISRTEQDRSQDGDGSFEIELPYDHPVVLMHLPYFPPKPVLVTIIANHRDDPEYRRVQTGAIYGFDQKGMFATLRCAEPGNPMAKLLPRASHGPNCRHTTYSVACGLNRNDFKTVVDSISYINGLDIVAPEFLAAGSGWFKYGYAENPANGEVRYITDHVGATVTLAYPFTGIDSSTVLHFFAGDDYKPETCRIKFNNKVHYLGFDFHPKYNIFSDGYRSGGSFNTVGVGPGTGFRIPFLS